MPTRQQLFEMGREAVQHARAALPTGADNWTNAAAGANACVVDMRADHPDTLDYTLADIEWLASDAREAGCGNCAEHAAVAFKYLYDQGIRPLDYRVVDPAAHAFVVIGEGENGVVVDAWADEVKAFREMAHTSTTSWYRAE